MLTTEPIERRLGLPALMAIYFALAALSLVYPPSRLWIGVFMPMATGFYALGLLFSAQAQGAHWQNKLTQKHFLFMLAMCLVTALVMHI